MTERGIRDVGGGPDSLRDQGIDPYPARSRRDHSIAAVAQERPSRAVIAGRIVAQHRNPGGSLTAITLRDQTGELELPLVETHAFSREDSGAVAHLAVGDIVECALVCTSGDTRVESVRLLAKSKRSLEELRRSDEPLARWASGSAQYQRMRRRSQILSSIRRFFEDRGVLEVETPILCPFPDVTPHLSSFASRYRDDSERSLDLFLHTSPELCMKQLLAAGYERIFQIVKFFRNGEATSLHNPEFTGVEWYQAYADYHTIMDQVQELICHLAEKHCGSTRLVYQGKEIDLAAPWERKTMRSLVEETTGIDLYEAGDRDTLARHLDHLGINCNEDDEWEDLFFRLFVGKVERDLGTPRPLFITEFPAPLASLAKLKPNDSRVAERFEAYVGGLELANGFTELNDPAEQRRRFAEEAARKQSAVAYPLRLDESFLRALDYGMPPAGGVALGVDRLVMILTDVAEVGEVMFFPFKHWMRPLGRNELRDGEEAGTGESASTLLNGHAGEKS